MPQRSAACLAWILRALRLGCLVAVAAALGACDRCGNFLPSSQDEIAACHGDPPPQ
jgi:hypothetical protein